MTVRDPAGTVRQTTTDSGGGFHFPGLAPAAYEVTVARAGFGAARRREVAVATGQTANLAFQLEIGPASETLDVHAKPGGVDLEEQKVEDVFSFLELLDLVQEQRIITDLAGWRFGAIPRGSD